MLKLLDFNLLFDTNPQQDMHALRAARKRGT
jgi:hypothetical protein